MTIPQTKRTSPRKQRKQQVRRSRQISIILVGLGLLVVAAAALGLLRPWEAKISPARVGQPISDLKLVDLQGKTVQMSDYQGKPVLINAWATWCPPCQAEMPLLQELYSRYQSQGFTLLAVNAGETQAQVQEFIDYYGYTFPVLLDPNAESLTSLGINSYPTSLFIGADGVVKQVHVGLFTEESLKSEIEPLLAGGAPAGESEAGNEISIEQAYEKYKAGTFLLDVRDVEEWDEYHVPGATLIPLGELESRLGELPTGQEIVVICRSGNRSKAGRDILLEAGFTNVSSMAGGLKAWRTAGYPTDPAP